MKSWFFSFCKYAWVSIASLSSEVFERRTTTGSEPFCLLINLDTNKFLLSSVLTLIREDLPKNLFKIAAQDCKKCPSGSRASLKNVACLSSLVSTNMDQPRTQGFSHFLSEKPWAGSAFTFLHFARHPKIWNLEWIVATNQTVPRGQISMDTVLALQVLHARGCVNTKPD